MSLKLKKINYDIYDDIETLLQHTPARVFNRQTDLIYKGHIPHAAYLLVNGRMCLKDKSHELPLEKGAIVGIKEILSNTPFKYNVVISEGSEVLILDKSTIEELSSNGHLHAIVKDINF